MKPQQSKHINVCMLIRVSDHVCVSLSFCPWPTSWLYIMMSWMAIRWGFGCWGQCSRLVINGLVIKMAQKGLAAVQTWSQRGNTGRECVAGWNQKAVLIICYSVCVCVWISCSGPGVLRSGIVKAVVTDFRVWGWGILVWGLVAKTGVYKSCGPSGEPFSVLEFLIGDYCFEGVVPERGGDTETWGEKWRLHRMYQKTNRTGRIQPKNQTGSGLSGFQCSPALWCSKWCLTW